MNSDSIPIDLILQILSRLPAKSVARFRCVSKQWASILGSQYFIKMFQTMSSAKPRLLFAIGEDGVWSFFSVPQLQNPQEKSSSTLVVAAELHAKLSTGYLRIYPSIDLRYLSCAYASGLIQLHGYRYNGRALVCNPNTGRYAILPFLLRYRKFHSFLGFDPIGKQYKVLFMAYQSGPGHHKIHTLGTGERGWRTVNCSLRCGIRSEGVCINGVLYFLVDTSDTVIGAPAVTSEYVIVCFDVRSEKFTFIDVERFCRLINYKGKLAVIFWEDDVDYYRNSHYVKDDVEDDVEDDVKDDVEDDVVCDAISELHVWVQEDNEKQEWSKYAYSWSDDKLFRGRDVSVAGVTPWGEIVFPMRKYTSEQPFYVFYFNPERYTLRRVEIQGFGKTFGSVWTFVNHVEDLNAFDLELLKSGHSPLVVPAKSFRI